MIKITGPSLPWKMTDDEKSRAYPYYKKLISSCLVLVGGFLILEHMWTYGQIDLLDWFGHETYGGLMILAAFLLMTDWSQWKKLKLWILKNQFR